MFRQRGTPYLQALFCSFAAFCCRLVLAATFIDPQGPPIFGDDSVGSLGQGQFIDLIGTQKMGLMVGPNDLGVNKLKMR